MQIPEIISVRWSWFLLLLLTALISGPLRAELPSGAQADVEKGMRAAKAGEYEIAVQNFQDARKLSPDAPEIYGYLGLAESKIPGRELRAIAWYGAYLAAKPHAANRAKIKQAIVGLQIKSLGGLKRFLETVVDAGNQYPDAKTRSDSLCRIAYTWGFIGDPESAMGSVPGPYTSQISSSFAPVTVNDQSAYEGNIARGQADAGDIAGAKKTLSGFSVDPQDAHSPIKPNVEYRIAMAQVRAGDASVALTTIDSVHRDFDPKTNPEGGNLDSKIDTECECVKEEVRAGNLEGARTFLTAAQKTFLEVKNIDAHADASQKIYSIPNIEDSIFYAQVPYLEGQLKAGDIAGAKKTLSLCTAMGYGYMDKRKSLLIDVEADLAKTQAKAGDIVGAKKTADQIPNDSNMDKLEKSNNQVDAAILHPDSMKMSSFYSTATDCPPAGLADDWVHMLAGELDQPWDLDLPGYLKGLATKNADPSGPFDMLASVAEDMSRERQTIDQMLKRQFVLSKEKANK